MHFIYSSSFDGKCFETGCGLLYLHSHQKELCASYYSYFTPLQSSLNLQLAALVFLVVEKTNYFWYVGIVLQPGNLYFAIVNMIIGLVSCNQRQKLTLYFYLLIYFITYPQKKLHFAYNILALAGLSFETYNNLPFVKLKDNLYYFTGFTCLFVHYGIGFYLEMTESVWGIETEAQVFLIILTCISSFALLNRKISKFVNFNIDQADSIHSVFHYISILKDKVKKSLVISGIESSHKAKCQQPDCFCRIAEFEQKVGFEKLYIRKILHSALIKFANVDFKQSLQGFYIEQLLRNTKLTLAIELFLKQNFYKWDIFKKVEYERVKQSMANSLKQIQAGYCWKMSFQDAFEYQSNFELLRRKVIELIEIKIQFWNEILKKSTKAIKLKNLGRLYLDRLNEMNRFYYSQVIDVEKQLGIFSGGIIYNLFLLTATNYKERAEINMKTFKKNNDPTQVKIYKLGILKASLSKERMSLIQNINAICLKMLGPSVTRAQYLGRSINQLVPSCYLQQHMNGMKRLRQFNQKCLIGAELETIFLVGYNGDIIACSVFLKLSPDIYNQLSVVTMFKNYKLSNEYIIIHQGNPLYTSNQSLDIEIVYSKQIQSILKQFEFRWKSVNLSNPKYPLVDPIKIQIKYKSLDYSITMSSPLCGSFTFPKKPPIHMAIHNQTKAYFAVQQIVQQNDLNAIKKIQDIIQNNQTQSQASSVSRRSSIVDILKQFQSNSGLKLFRSFYIGMMAIFLTVAFCVCIHHLATDIKWVTDQKANYINLYQIHYDIQYQISNFVSKGLVSYGIENGVISNSQYSSDSGRLNYLDGMPNEVLKICNSLSLLIKDKDNTNQGMDESYHDLMTTVLTINTDQGAITFKFNNIINLAISSCFQLANGFKLKGLLISDLYWDYIYIFYDKIFDHLKTKIDYQLWYYTTINTVLFIVFSVIFIVITIPIYFGKKKIKDQQNYIFDLMTSVTPDLIQQDISNLQQLQINVKSNYSNSFNFQQKFIINGDHMQQCGQDNQLSVGTDSKRKRTGQLDSTGNNKPQIFLMVIVIIFIAFLFAIFLLRKTYINKLKSQTGNISQQYFWRNQRMDVLLNIKKWIFNFQSSDLLQNKTLQKWIQDSLRYRRKYFLIRNSNAQAPIDCQKAAIFCKNGTTSQLSVNVFFATLAVTTFDLETPMYIGSLQVLTDLSSQFSNKYLSQRIEQINRVSNQVPTNTNIFFAVFWVFLGIAIILTILYLKKVKKQYLYLTRFITFLTEEMIKKNKRVESYLQRLMKAEE